MFAMNSSHILNEFLAQDCNPRVRDEILAEIKAIGDSKADVVRIFEYNRFLVRIDFRCGEVSVEDDLDPSEQGKCVLALSTFVAAISGRKTRN